MANHAAEQAVILIPSLEPDERLPAYIRKLKEGGFAHIVVIDDGSSEKYQPIFEEVDAVEDTVVLHHEVNRGKGVALKTGYKYIMENMPDITGVITADADGQHTVADCLHLAEQLEKGERLFIYTDGIHEATAKDNSMFGLNRMKAALNTNKEGSPRQILEGVHDAIIEFVGDAPQFDDVTMLCFEYLPDHKEV